MAAAGCAATALAACTTMNASHAGRTMGRQCTAAMLRIRAGREGEGPGAHGDIQFTDVGRARCILGGLPWVTIATSAGTPLPVTLTRTAGVTAQQAVLAPGHVDAADLTVFWSNWCGRAPGPLTVRITLPASAGTVTGPFDGPPDYGFVPRCLDVHQPSTVSVIADYEAGTGS